MIVTSWTSYPPYIKSIANPQFANARAGIGRIYECRKQFLLALEAYLQAYPQKPELSKQSSVASVWRGTGDRQRSYRQDSVCRSE